MIKKHKMNKSTFLNIVLSIVILCLLAFGGTYAYFTAVAQDRTANITTGYVKLFADENFQLSATSVLPGDTIAASGLTLTPVTSDPEGEWIAIRVSITGEKADVLSINKAGVGEDWIEIEETGIFVYKAKTTSPVVVFDGGFEFSKDIEDTWYDKAEDGSTPTTSQNGLMNATITIKVEARAIQGSNIDDIELAKTELQKLF
ncbi:MAG: hypothetical protein IJW36_01280 [Clostridia bacterium]|nr:hypothetical protein [Clostridia bacterium]